MNRASNKMPSVGLVHPTTAHSKTNVQILQALSRLVDTLNAEVTP